MSTPEQPTPPPPNPEAMPPQAPHWGPPPGFAPVPGMPVEPPRAAGPGRKVLLLTALGGLVLGAILVGGVWVGTSLGVAGTESTAARDADTACGIIARLPDMTEDSLTRQHANRAAGAAALAAAAAEDDQRYSELSEAASGMLQAIQVYNLDLINNRIVAARAACDDL
jgi:hypothetical protein